MSVSWGYMCEVCKDKDCIDHHLTIIPKSLIVVITAYHDNNHTLHVSDIQGASLMTINNDVAINKIENHSNQCLCYEVIMTGLAIENYEIKAVNTIMGDKVMIHLQKE